MYPMTWVKLDDGFADHPKIVDLPGEAFKLHVAGLCWCSRNLTDGHIPTSVAPRLTTKSTRRTIQTLVLAGLWLATQGGWEINDYLTFNPSRTQVLADRESAAERQRKRRSHAVTPPVTNAVTTPVSNGVSHTTPTRPQPVTARSTSSSQRPQRPDERRGDLAKMAENANRTDTEPPAADPLAKIREARARIHPDPPEDPAA